MAAIVLVGFMATGKSEVGRRLAQRLGRSFVDTDAMVEARAGKSVARIFADEGEEVFRRLERDAVAEATGRGDAVVALGGGAVLDPVNVASARTAGVVVYLTARPDVILTRLGDATRRPLLAGCDPGVVVTRLLGERRAAYERAADVTVDTSERTVDQVVAEIETSLRSRRRGERWTLST